MKNPFLSIIRALRRYIELKRMPLRLEFVLSDYCNLNCKGCTHYSPLASKEFEPLESMVANMAALSRVCGDEVKQAYLIGGETLLYPRLVEAMTALRRYFGTQELYIFTNGIVLSRMSDEFWEMARKLDFIIAITRYPIKIDYDALINLCREKGVRVSVFGDRGMADSFFRFSLDPSKSQNARISHFKCFNRGCISIVGDRLYPCSISACVRHLNKAVGTDFSHVERDYLIISDIVSCSQITKLRDNPVPFCSYCINPPTTVSYELSRRQKSEWVNE